VRPYPISPRSPEDRFVVAAYDFEADRTRFDARPLPYCERDEGLYVDLGVRIADIVTRELFELGRFDLVECRNLAAALAEQDLGRSGRFDAATVAGVGRLVGAELILVGAISELSIDRASAVVPGFLGGAVVTTVTVSVASLQQSLRLLRVGTVRQAIVAAALRNAIRAAVEGAALRSPRSVERRIRCRVGGWRPMALRTATFYVDSVAHPPSCSPFFANANLRKLCDRLPTRCRWIRLNPRRFTRGRIVGTMHQAACMVLQGSAESNCRNKKGTPCARA
jgi:hypothetical protein